MAEAPAAGAGAGPGGGAAAGIAAGGIEQQAVKPEDARKYVSDFVFDPAAVAQLPDDKVVEYHGRVSAKVKAEIDKANQARDWRKEIAGELPDAQKTLERFQSPKALYEAYNGMRTKLSTGELKVATPYPEKGTAEEQAAWRAEQQVPSKAEEYKTDAVPKEKIHADDKPFVDSFLKYAHSKHMSQALVNDGLQFWIQERDERVARNAEGLKVVQQQTEDKLRSVWGPEYRPNMNRIVSLINSEVPKDSPLAREMVEACKMSPELSQFLAGVSMKLNPASSLLPISGEGQEKSISDWLQAADKLMRTNRKAYNKSEYSRDYQKYAAAYQEQTGKSWAGR